MRAIVQRVKQASVNIKQKVYSSIDSGYLVLLGISNSDTEKDMTYIIDKLLNLRIFPDETDKINLSIRDLDYEILLVSQFTLYGDARKGRRPSFTESAKPDDANNIYQKFVKQIRLQYNDNKIKTGVFKEQMDVQLINDGPFTILLDSEKKF